MNPENGPWETAQIKQLIARYMESGGTLTGPLLDILGGRYLCYLEEDQLKQIDPDAIRHTERLDLSTCPQGKKNILYGKARQAFAGQEGTGAYYRLIQPYLGGAPVEDLKKLVGSEVTMDIGTFLSLNPEELQKLSVQDVKGLMGVNLPALKEEENHPSIARWIKSQYQSELDTLGIGLTGGMTAPSPTEARSTAMNVSSDARADAPVTPIPAANRSATPDGHTPTPSSLTSAGWHPVIPVAATGSHLTPFSNVTPVAIAVTNITAPSIVAVPKVDFAAETTVVSPNVTAMSEDALSRSPASTTGRGFNTTAADSSTPVLLNTTVDSAVTFPTEVTATSSDFTTPSDGIIGGAAVPVFMARDANTTISGRTTVDSNTTTTGDAALPATTVDSTTVVPTNITSGSNNTLVGILAPHATGGTNLTFSANTTPATSNTTTHTSPPPVATDSNMTRAPNTTFSPTTAVLVNLTTSARASTTESKGFASTRSGVTLTSTARPPAPPQPRPNATSPSSTKRPSSKAPPRTKAPVYPTPNGYINIQPLSALASRGSLNWLLLMLSLIAGVSVQRWHL
ncbi:uncharacterized protein LOC144584658 [Pogona vitticeps]